VGEPATFEDFAIVALFLAGGMLGGGAVCALHGWLIAKWLALAKKGQAPFFSPSHSTGARLLSGSRLNSLSCAPSSPERRGWS
jgi:hypothetical protein